MTTGRPTIDVASIIEACALGRSAVRLILACALVTFFDGYDMNVIAFAAPYLAPVYHLDKIMLGNIFSAGIAGTLLGGFVFGYVGDRIGRRMSIILATALFGAFTLALSFAAGYVQFVTLRFFGGIALGGAIPLTWALGTEYVASRYRATIVTLIMLGYGVGNFAAGPISVALIPRFGWLSVFAFGGIASLLVVTILLAALPESPRFLIASGRRPEVLARTVRRLAPDREVPDTAQFVLPDEAHSRGSRHNVAALFSGPLRSITPLLWAGYIASSMTMFFLISWGPIVYEGLGFSRNSAAWITASTTFAGSVGGIALMRFTDKIGVISLAAAPLIAVPLLIVQGYAHVGQAAFIALMATLMFFLGGAHFGVTSITGLFYPTTYRGLGTGWASSVAKIGSITGPWIGGFILSSHLPLQHVFAVMAVCPAVLCACMFAIGLAQRRTQRSALFALSPSTTP